MDNNDKVIELRLDEYYSLLNVIKEQNEIIDKYNQLVENYKDAIEKQNDQLHKTVELIEKRSNIVPGNKNQEKTIIPFDSKKVENMSI